jgi:deoxyhypusine monooxygenase
MMKIDENTIPRLGKILIDQKEPIAKRMRVVFTLRNLGGDDGVDAMTPALNDPSALLSHEVAYCLGQMRNKRALPKLEATLRNEALSSMVRHEAAEAMGAIGSDASIPILKEFSTHPTPEISETCVCALDLISWRGKAEVAEESELYGSVDPAPPAKEVNVPALREKLNNKQLTHFERYRALFKLRNIGTEAAVNAITSAFDDASALFRHELAYVLGQMQSPYAIEALKKVLVDAQQHEMVRHEAAEALGAIATDDTLPVLKEFAGDDQQVVKQSCEVALDIHDYFTSDQFQFSDVLAAKDDV